MATRMPALALVLFITGCDDQGSRSGDDSGGGPADATGGGGGGGPSVNQSGRRIKMNVLRTPDGAKSFTGWRDTELNLDCNFQLAADGATRCLPVTTAFHTANLYFADAGCTIPVATGSSCPGGEPRYILQYPAAACSSGGHRVFQAGTRYASAYLKSGANCTAFAPTPGYAYYALGAEVPPATFQSASAAVE